MVWQDIVLSVAELILAVSVIPQIIEGFKKKKGYITYATSIASTTSLFLVTIAFFTLGLYSAASMALFNTVLWAIFIIQRTVWGGP